jgi:hypothetical protein
VVLPRRLTILAVLVAVLLSFVVLQAGTAGPAAADAGVAPSDPPQRTFTYTVRTRGTVYGDVEEFRRLASVTLNDRRGWSLGGAFRFREVSANPDFVLWLAEPSAVAAFGSICDSTYSCRVGSNVVINDLRWRKGTPVWTDIAEYHHYVVNHEVGHWLGMGHRSCTGSGDLAPAMQQQSIGLHGCVTNTWPTAAEKSDVARRYRVTLRSVRPDVYALKSGTRGTEVHVLDGQNRFDRFDGHYLTAATQASSFGLYDYTLADRNRDGVDDLIGIKKGSNSSHVEVHVLDGASGYRTWQLHTSTPLGGGATGVWSYDAADVDGDGYLDIVGINRQGAGGAHTTVHVLDGASRYQRFLLQATTPLPALNGSWSAFTLGDHDRDGIPDLYAVRRRGTASQHTEVDVIDGASGFRTRVAHVATPLPWTDESWDFAADDYDGDGWDELWGIKRNGGSGQTEVHVLADRSYSSWVAHESTPVPQTGGSDLWRFPVG